VRATEINRACSRPPVAQFADRNLIHAEEELVRTTVSFTVALNVKPTFLDYETARGMPVRAFSAVCSVQVMIWQRGFTIASDRFSIALAPSESRVFHSSSAVRHDMLAQACVAYAS
jgi:hypothetical protein